LDTFYYLQIFTTFLLLFTLYKEISPVCYLFTYSMPVYRFKLEALSVMFLKSTGLTSDLIASLYVSSDWEDKLKRLLTDTFGQMTDNQERM
jgi:hypothetical protein